ncbi:TetR/AcrR family transcriptional regulator C-terminal domain-containing protein, partial [Mycobacterium sp.]|uniref:TetR/AcrR family transcriptional regulator C-terminal domain-containing protein n=1 Tax=Mycobacterium sp. TaxID=1785 RepID=UPI001277C254
PAPAAMLFPCRGVGEVEILDRDRFDPGAPTDLETMRVVEGILAILLAGGVRPQAAAWVIDALLLYVAAYCLEESIVRQRSAHDDVAWVLDRDELLRRFTALPAETFPHTSRHAAELIAGEGHDRFDFTLTLMIDGLAHR